MNELLLSAETAQTLARGSVVRVTSAGVLVTSHVFAEEGRLCDVLETSRERPLFAQGDAVLIWRSPDERKRDVVVGRIGTPASREAGTNDDDALPSQLVIEARNGLTLKCGSGSITIREDGKILIKGKDLVSHATRMNRIKGGSVQIH